MWQIRGAYVAVTLGLRFHKPGGIAESPVRCHGRCRGLGACRRYPCFLVLVNPDVLIFWFPGRIAALLATHSMRATIYVCK
jgi:hypothetical protein